MSLPGAIATCIIILLLRVPFAGGDSSEATSEAFMMEQVLSESGCGAFAGLVAATAAAGEVLRAQIAGDDGGTGLTIFCPDDEAVAAFGRRRFSNLSADDQVALLLYHGAEETLGAVYFREVRTLANGPRNYDIHIYQGTVLISSSKNAALLTKKVVDNGRLVIYLIDSVLVPGERTAFPWHWELVLLVVLCIVIGLSPLALPLVLLVRRLIRSCQDCATAHVSAARVTTHG